MAEGGELPFLRWLVQTDRPSPGVEVPIGDDGAVLQWPGGSLVVVADAIAEDSHFTAGDAPALVGRKALAVNLSDLAAMGAKPLAAVATAALPHGFDPEMARAMTEGMRELGERHGCHLVGGDTVTHRGPVVLSVTAFGVVRAGAAVVRTGARPGHLVAVTGQLGGSRGGRHLTFEPRLRESERLVALGPPSAMIDVSDGLLLDLSRICEASGGLGFRLESAAIPVSPESGGLEEACADGEDFELLVTAEATVMERMLASWELETPLTQIGEITDSGYLMVDSGKEREVAPRGYSHG